MIYRFAKTIKNLTSYFNNSCNVFIGSFEIIRIRTLRVGLKIRKDTVNVDKFPTAKWIFYIMKPGIRKPCLLECIGCIKEEIVRLRPAINTMERFNFTAGFSWLIFIFFFTPCFLIMFIIFPKKIIINRSGLTLR